MTFQVEDRRVDTTRNTMVNTFLDVSKQGNLTVDKITLIDDTYIKTKTDDCIIFGYEDCIVIGGTLIPKEQIKHVTFKDDKEGVKNMAVSNILRSDEEDE